jgi:hypothetical protein
MTVRFVAALTCIAALAACADNPAPSRNPNPSDAMAPQGRDPGAIANTTAEQDCRFATAAQVGVDQSNVRVRSSSMGENFTTVLLDVGGAEAPWACEWGGDGVERVYYTAEG